MNFRSFNDLNLAILSNLSKIPLKTDLIVGIPRSGLLAANILALHLNIAVTDLDGFLDGRILSGGRRITNFLKPFNDYRSIIVLDDSIMTGRSMQSAKIMVEKCNYDKEITYGVVFATYNTLSFVDFYFNICPAPRMFEWNLMHHVHLNFCCVDLDGVLCEDPTEDENDDGEKYKHFLLNALPLLRTTRKLGCIVTNRLEKYRSITEFWLSNNHISYGSLFMCDLPSKEARVKANQHAEFKAHIYLKTESVLFIESSEWQSNKIAKIANRPVYCTDIRKMIYPSLIKL